MAEMGARKAPRAVGPGAAGFFSLVLAASIPVLPPIGVFLGLLAPLPLVHLAASGRSSFTGWGWVAVLLVGASLALRQPWLAAAAFGYLIVAALPSLTIEAWWRRTWSAGRWLAVASLAGLAMVIAFVTAWYYPDPPGAAIAETFARQTAANSEALDLLAAASGRGVDARDYVLSMARLSGFLLPALVAAYLQAGLLWLRPRLAALGIPRGTEQFAAFSSEEWLPVAFALGGLGLVFAGGSVHWVCANLFVVVLSLYFFHGLAIIHFYLGPRLASNRWVKVFLFLLVLTPVGVALPLVGLVDNFFSLRRGPQLSGGNEA